jgi:hypothetical protein
MSRKDNRRTLNALDESWTPTSTTARVALAPVAFPAGLLALITDAVVVHPVCVLDDAWGDTVDWLWTPKPGESRFRRAVLTPLAALATPFVFVGDWLGRALLPLPPRQESEREDES